MTGYFVEHMLSLLHFSSTPGTAVKSAWVFFVAVVGHSRGISFSGYSVKKIVLWQISISTSLHGLMSL